MNVEEFIALADRILRGDAQAAKALRDYCATAGLDYDIILAHVHELLALRENWEQSKRTDLVLTLTKRLAKFKNDPVLGAVLDMPARVFYEQGFNNLVLARLAREPGAPTSADGAGSEPPKVAQASKEISLPKRPKVLLTWKKTWRKVKGWTGQYTYDEICNRLAGTPLACSVKQLSKIITAGEAGLLD